MPRGIYDRKKSKWGKKKSFNLVKVNQENSVIEAKRDGTNSRYDILDANFIYLMATLAKVGADKYGDFNFHVGKPTGDRTPLNHLWDHLIKYQHNEPYKGNIEDRRMHLVAIAFNAMMEFWYETNKK